jgi:hypothetical protein
MIKDIWNEVRVLMRAATPAQAIAGELLEAEMSLLKAESGVEWAQASVMYNKSRIKRLKAYLASTEEVKEAV